jgi:hypothetical protein
MLFYKKMLSLCESALKNGGSARLLAGRERVKEVLLKHGAIARFPSYSGGSFCQIVRVDQGAGAHFLWG